MKWVESERLILREFSISDAHSLLQLNNNPNVLKYTGDVPFRDLLEAETFVNNYTYQKELSLGRLAVCLKKNNTFIGWCGFKKHPSYTDLGFRFMEEHWNQGFATEAAKACLSLLDKPHFPLPLVGRCHPKNESSKRVLQKLGFHYSHKEEVSGIGSTLIYVYQF